MTSSPSTYLSHSSPTSQPSPTGSTSVGDGKQCGAAAAGCPGKNHSSGKFFLRSHVVYGRHEFENLYIESAPANAENMIPVFTSDHSKAYLDYYDLNTGGLQFYHAKRATRGLIINIDND
ncbi:hypothetical protein DPSP01_013725 [Paraphaeosphaeria sporulosa]